MQNQLFKSTFAILATAIVRRKFSNPWGINLFDRTEQDDILTVSYIEIV